MRIGMLNWWQFGFMALFASLGFIRFAEGEGGGGEPGAWIPDDITDEGARETLSGYDSPSAAFAGLHEMKVASSQPLVDRLVAADPELEADRETLARFESPEKLGKSYLELRKKVGENPLVAPGEDASDEAKAEFANQLATLAGRPEKPEDYTYKPPESAVEAGLNMEMFSGRMKEMHDAGFSDAQVTQAMKIFEEEAGFTAQGIQQHLEAQAEESKSWAKETWGDAADTNLALAGRAMEKLGVKENLKQSGMINDKGMLDAFYQLSQAIGEGNLPPAGGGEGGSAKERLAALKKDPAYMNPRLRVGDKKNIMADVLSLQKEITG